MTCSSSDLDFDDLSGVGLFVLHIIDDKLWEFGKK